MTVVLVLGYPASGKTTVAQKFIDIGYEQLSRDIESKNGKIRSLLPKLEAKIKAGKNVVLDNLFPTAEIRKPFIELAKKYKVPVECHWVATSIEDSQFNACQRMMDRYGKIFSPDEIKKHQDSNIFPPAVLFKYRKDFEKPDKSEGFDIIRKIPFKRKSKNYSGRAIILDYDGTLRTSLDGQKYPTEPKHVEILPNRKRVLKDFVEDGYLLLGVSNQNGIAKGKLTEFNAIACFERTNDLLGYCIDYSFCPHKVPPMTCWCRKPSPGLGVQFIERYKLDPAKTIMVGDLTSDKTFANRCGFKYIEAEEFFA